MNLQAPFWLALHFDTSPNFVQLTHTYLAEAFNESEFEKIFSAPRILNAQKLWII